MLGCAWHNTSKDRQTITLATSGMHRTEQGPAEATALLLKHQVCIGSAVLCTMLAPFAQAVHQAQLLN